MIFFTCFVILNLKGGPSNTAIVLSSEPVMIRKGLVGLKSQELMGLDWPEISPTDVPVSDIKTCPKRSRPSPTATILWLSGDQAISLIGPPNGWNSFFRICSLLTVSQILIFPLWSAKKKCKIWHFCKWIYWFTSRCDVETTWWIFGNVNWTRMFGINIRYCRIL